MQALTKHVTRTLLAGVVALLPIGGLILGVVYAEATIAGSWLAKQRFYVPGLGLLAVVASTYLLGLLLTTLLGKWLWSAVDRLLERLPALGMLYRTLKQVLGYGAGEHALFEGVVLVPGRDGRGGEIGLVTRRLPAGADTPERLLVFVPAAPTPTSGRVVLLDAAETQTLAMSVHDGLMLLVALGKLEADGAALPALAAARAR